jgi:osomolarity two-component system, response regulator SKN7
MPKLDGVSATNMIRKFDTGSPIIAMTSNSKPNEIMTYYSSGGCAQLNYQATVLITITPGMNDILPKPFSKQGLFDMLEKHLTHLKNIQQMSRNIPRGPGIPPLSDLNFEQALMQNASPSQLSLPGPSSSSQLSMQQQQASSSSSSQGASGNNAEGNSNGGIRTPSPFNMSSFFALNTDQGDENRINPLAGMGLTDEQYSMMLANIVNGDNFMGGLDVSGSTSGASSPGGMFGMGMGGGSGVKRGYEDVGGSEMEGPAKKSRFEVIE